MTAIGNERWTCGVCSAESEQMSLESGHSEQPPDFDTRPGEPVRSTIPHWMHECPKCGYAAPDLRITSPEAVAIVRSGEYQALHGEEGLSLLVRRFLCHALLLERLGAFSDAGWVSLHAAWVCDDESAAPAAVRCRRQAIRLWRHGKEHGQGFGEDHTQEFALVTDVLRRSGDFDDARDACLEALQAEDLDPIIDDLMRRQLVLIQQRDTACHSLAEILDRPKQGDRVTLH